MYPAITTVFLVLAAASFSILVIGLVVAVIQDVYRYKDLQERLRRDRERKVAKEES